MYSKKYRKNHEFTCMTFTINTAPAKGFTPPEMVEAAEEGSLLERLLREAVTEEEHTLLCLVDELADELWRIGSDRPERYSMASAMRGELRAMFTSKGYSERRFYATLNGMKERMCL